MVLVGVLYILFEKSILSSPEGSTRTSPVLDSPSSSVLGVQIGLIILAMFVTKSSVTSIQSKRGLPFGNQVVGWIVLSTRHALWIDELVLTMSGSCISYRALFTWPPPK